MSDMIPLAFFLAIEARPVVPGDDTWQHPLPLSRRPQTTNNKETVTYGDYFTAVGDFLEKDHYRAVKVALVDIFGVKADMLRVRRLAVFLVKHGEFYHPARVIVKYGQGEFSFVVNVAISKTGRDHLKGEFNLLARLFPEFELPALPKVYHQAEIPSGDNTKIPMFSGQWFEGFCEFHITANHPENMSNLIVWDQNDTRFYLTKQQAEDVYRQVAFILTTVYKFFTFEHISAWHHAAGDFILKSVDTTRVDLRLITVRKYAPLIENAEPDPATLVEALLLFFLNLTIRNRLDRLDGTGVLAWADDYALKGTVLGFFKGLSRVITKEDLPGTFHDDFKNYIQAHSPEALFDLFSAVADRIPGTSPEHAFINKRLKKHADLFCSLLGAGDCPDQSDPDTT
ncbi:MAG: hypothetical protein GY697_27155 [Desulfobacterales bacterium]|nr:hypothetical protein [Desulfobacterales bacterium]